jgi:heterodisulfide reductase subunit A
MPRVTIDGRTGDLAEGTTILDAARSLGVGIPSLCHVKGLPPDPVCRVCTVEVVQGGRSRMLTACSRPVEEGMVVHTRSERTLRHRRLLIQLLLARSPKAEPVRRLAAEEGIDASPLAPAEEPDDCILCGRCVRACAEISGAEVLGFVGRGLDRRVALPFDEPSERCIECGACARVCPTGCITIEDEAGRAVPHDDLILGPNSAIRIATYQAVPSRPFVDPDACIHLETGGCGICERVCDAGAIDLAMGEEVVERRVGSIIVATGFRTFDPGHLRHYGHGRLDNVLTTLELERMANAAGPTGGRIRLSDGSEPKRVAFVHCVGSRDQQEHEYCSRVCCMVALKQAHLVRDRVPSAEVFSFYIDLRCFGKGYEEFYHRTLREGVRFVRGRVASVRPGGPDDELPLVVRAEDTLLGATLSVPVDMVVLSVGLEAAEGTEALARTLGLGVGRDGWLLEQHPKLGPVSTAVDGIFLAGACQGPKDIPDSVAQGLAAAGRAMALADRGVVEIAGSTAEIDPEVCAGCQECLVGCPARAIAFDEARRVCVVDDRTCQGCGACAAQCRSGAARARHFTDEQMLIEIEGVLR